MQFLLLLTALLSALTGVAAGPRADDSRLARAEERLVASAAAAVRQGGVTARPVQPVPGIARSLLTALRQAVVAAAAPLARVRFIE